MTTEQSVRTTAETLNEFFTRFGGGDRKGVLELFTETTDWNVPGSPVVPWTGRRSTREEIDTFIGHAYELVSTEAFAVEQVVVDGEHAIALGSFTHLVKATGKRFVSDFALHVRVVDGTLRLYHMFEDSAAAAEAFTA
ncbi:nuclear transport factor 2 family protein [Kitasatospora sp. NBC_01250]|uniref:nuclear transport factor 2 family protein n=1 Tax=unclassified Kitasatospora TaxID=2633591 RepID=UPI002E164632|nr:MULTISPECIES: nuclear transport factor 2 family protein [unclassified Kitasatospora]WSJ68419.1 nuclear transport factor 2 family protein [Kitasatospora sp. NBC_01302]